MRQTISDAAAVTVAAAATLLSRLLSQSWVVTLTATVILAALAGALMAATADAYAQPSGLGTHPAICPPRPADETPAPDSPDDTTIAQELDDACEHQVLDTQTLDSDLQAVDGDVKAGTKTLDQDDAQLDTDLQNLDGDVRTLDGDVKAGQSSGAQGNVTVSNWPESQAVHFDPTAGASLDGDAEAIHDDLWVLVGTIVGCWLFGLALQKVWP